MLGRSCEVGIILPDLGSDCFGAIGAFWFRLFMGWPALGGWVWPERFRVDRVAERLVRLLKGSKLVLEVFSMSGWLMPLDMEVMSRRGMEMGD